MTKVYPNVAYVSAYDERQQTWADHGAVAVLTVWKKSLLLNCNGFTVFDSQGNLIFRVDNYVSGNKDEILLMDAAGTPLVTIRRKRLSLGDKWLVFEGEKTLKPRFSAKKNVNILNNKCLAQVVSSEDVNYCENGNKKVVYEMEGSFAQRCCTVYDNNRKRVAEIKRKEAAAGGVAFGADVFRLIVEPDVDTALAMAFVILLDQMFGSSSR